MLSVHCNHSRNTPFFGREPRTILFLIIAFVFITKHCKVSYPNLLFHFNQFLHNRSRTLSLDLWWTIVYQICQIVPRRRGWLCNLWFYFNKSKYSIFIFQTPSCSIWVLMSWTSSGDSISNSWSKEKPATSDEFSTMSSANRISTLSIRTQCQVCVVSWLRYLCFHCRRYSTYSSFADTKQNNLFEEKCQGIKSYLWVEFARAPLPLPGIDEQTESVIIVLHRRNVWCPSTHWRSKWNSWVEMMLMLSPQGIASKGKHMTGSWRYA